MMKTIVFTQHIKTKKAGTNVTKHAQHKII